MGWGHRFLLQAMHQQEAGDWRAPSPPCESPGTALYIAPASKTWLTIGINFALVSGYLWMAA
jgi:hypothetical protein